MAAVDRRQAAGLGRLLVAEAGHFRASLVAVTGPYGLFGAVNSTKRLPSANSTTFEVCGCAFSVTASCSALPGRSPTSLDGPIPSWRSTSP